MSVWCAKNRNQAFDAAMAGKETTTNASSSKDAKSTKNDSKNSKIESKDAKADCNNIIASHFDLGVKLRITGTPTMVFADGSMLSSYLPPEKLANIAIEHANLQR
jgi:thiol:disulfide interchange protein DsbC